MRGVHQRLGRMPRGSAAPELLADLGELPEASKEPLHEAIHVLDERALCGERFGAAAVPGLASRWAAASRATSASAWSRVSRSRAMSTLIAPLRPPCLKLATAMRARPAAVAGPRDQPPCSRHRRRAFMAGPWHGVPARVLAPHRADVLGSPPTTPCRKALFAQPRRSPGVAAATSSAGSMG